MVETSPLGTLKVLAPVPHVPATYAPVLMAQSLGYAAAEGLDLHVVAPARAGEVGAVGRLDLNAGLFGGGGLPLRRLPAPAIDRLTPAACLYARDDLIAERPAAYAALGRAVAKGTLFALTNQEAT